MRSLPLVLGIALSALAADSRLAAQPNNVLIILADDLGVDRVSAYQESASSPQTPAIDALAERGVLFRNAWAYPLCSPTRACIMTGRYAVRHRVGNLAAAGRVLSPCEITLPEFLDDQQSGYAHAAIGKWHLDTQASAGELGPNLAGWSEFRGFALGGAIFYRQWNRTVNGVTASSTNYSTTQMVNDALAWIGSVPEPWVCYLAFNAPHSPYHAPPPGLHTQTFTMGPEKDPTTHYKAMVEAMDKEIGNLITGLGAAVNRTNIFFVGDNGTPGEVADPAFLPAKGSLYEGGVNVPFIVAGPDVKVVPREDAGVVSTVDLFATVAQLCGLTPSIPSVTLDSVSLVPHLNGPDAMVRSTVYAEVFKEGTTGDPRNLAAVRNHRYKLIRSVAINPPVAVPDEFYDLLEDPTESIPLQYSQLSSTVQGIYDGFVAEIMALQEELDMRTPYGATGCVGSNGNPIVCSSGTPRINMTYNVELQNGVPGEVGTLLIGLSNTMWGPLTLPFPLGSLGPPNCFIYASSESYIGGVPIDAQGRASVPLTIPNVPILIGSELFHSWLLTDPVANLTATDGLQIVVGA